MTPGAQPLVTIGLPVYNAARFLPDTLRSIFAQTLTDWELIAVDDGSTDGGIDFLRRISDPRVRVLKSDGRRRGLAVRLNQIAYAARGRYLARMDADDMMDPRRLQSQLDFLWAHPDVDVVGCGLYLVDKNTNAVAEVSCPAAHDTIFADPLRTLGIAHATVMAQAAWFLAHPYDESNFRCEDWQLFYRTRNESRYSNVTEPLYFYRLFESFSLRKYCAHKWRMVELSWGLPRAECSQARCLRMTFRSVFDMALYAAATATGTHSWLLRRRGKSMQGNPFFESAIATIRRTALPGVTTGGAAKSASQPHGQGVPEGTSAPEDLRPTTPSSQA